VGTIDKKGISSIITDSIYSAEAFRWVYKKIAFQKTPLKRVVSKLEDRYGVQFAFRDSELANKEFTSSFDDESLEEVLKVLTLSLDISYEKKGNKIYFTKER
jgi:ferric-dicitrate binding protein FerR (iron transport regulator)